MLEVLRKMGLVRGMFRRTRRREPDQLLELYSFEACSACSRVRAVLTELDIDYVHRSCPRGESSTRADLRRLGGKARVPFLVDPNTDTMLYESRDIVRYLESTYGPTVRS